MNCDFLNTTNRLYLLIK